jgi:hypothetical protein
MMPEPKYGHAYCTCCSGEIDLSDNPRGFSRTFDNFAAGEEQLLCYLCNDCASKFESNDLAGQQAIAMEVFQQVTASPEEFWALTTLSSLVLNNYDLVKAIEDGADLSRETHRDFYEGRISLEDLCWMRRVGLC